VPALGPLYDYAWFVGFGVSALAHLALMKLAPPKIAVLAKAEAAWRRKGQ